MLFFRHKLLLALLESLGGSVAATDFQKHLFLFTRLYESEKSFEFLPYRYGCYSFEAAAHKRKLISQGRLHDDSNWQITRPRLSYLQALPKIYHARIKTYAANQGKMSGASLIRHVYKNYPYYATRSEIAEDHLSETELAGVFAARPKTRRKSMFFTIGYEGQRIETYLNQLLTNDIRALVDVRKNPISRKYGFSKSALSEFCNRFGIYYAHIPELGISSRLRRDLSDHKDYDKLFEHYDNEILPRNMEKIHELMQFFVEYKRIAITCFERDHYRCHRDRVVKAAAASTQDPIAFMHL